MKSHTLEPATLYCRFILWSIDSCQNMLSVEQYHMAVFWAQLSAHQGHMFFLKLSTDKLLVFN